MKTVPDYFGCNVFDDSVMKATLSADVYRSLKRTIDGGHKLDLDALVSAAYRHNGRKA